MPPPISIKEIPNKLSNTLTTSTAATSQPSLQKLLYDRKSAAFVLSISVRSLDYLIAQKRLAFRKIGAKVLIPHGELVKFSRADHGALLPQVAN